MTNFDDRLATRLRALDAAIPEAAPADVAAGRAVLARVGRRRPTLRRGLVLFAAAAALLVGTSAVIGGRMLFEPRPEPALEAALMGISGSRDCLTADAAETEIRATFTSLGYEGWDVERAQGVRSDGCVSWAIMSETHAVLLLPGTSKTAAAMFDSVSAELINRCLGRDDAIELVRTSFASIGVTDLEIRADRDGPQAAPVDQIARWQQHVAQGCYVLIGVTSLGDDGRRILYLWGD